MKHSNKPSVSGISNETFLKTESASSLQGSAEPNSPDTSISNGSETYPHKIDALKNWFRTRPIVEKFCALPTYIQSWGLTLFFMGTATIIAFCFFHALKNPTANIALTYILAVFLVARFTDGYSFGLFSSFVGVVCVNFLFTYPYFALDFTMAGYPITFVAMFSISSITSAITSNMKTQARVLAEREKMLMEAEKEKMRANLLRAISHDLRTPLTSIIGSSTVYLENGSSLPEVEKNALVRHILEDSNWLLNMVENLLSVTRINNETAKVTKTSEPVEEVLSEAMIRLKKRLPDANIHVRVPEEFLMVPMDAVLIEQVLINLLENSVVHAESTEPIECYVESLSDYAIFHVRDYGVGIPPEKLATIFDGSSSTTSTSPDGRKGMGIGFPSVKQSFSPTAAKSGQSTTHAVPNFTLLFQRRTNNMTHKLSILLVEDEKNICDFISASLSAQDYRISTAHTGKEALPIITSQCPDLILLDLGLPDMDGMEIIRQVRTWSSIPIIVLSARTQEQEKVRALDLGADDYLTKPIGTSELLARIRTALRHSNRLNTASPLYKRPFHAKGLTIDFEKHLVSVDGRDVHLTQIEFKIISLLAQNSGRVMTYDTIISNIWGRMRTMITVFCA